MRIWVCLVCLWRRCFWCEVLQFNNVIFNVFLVSHPCEVLHERSSRWWDGNTPSTPPLPRCFFSSSHAMARFMKQFAAVGSFPSDKGDLQGSRLLLDDGAGKQNRTGAWRGDPRGGPSTPRRLEGRQTPRYEFWSIQQKSRKTPQVTTSG